MATTNPTVTSDWVRLVTAGDEFLLTLTDRSQPVEVVTRDNDSQPTVASGHQIAPGEGVNRTLIGPGYVFFRTADPAGTSVTVALTAWTP